MRQRHRITFNQFSAPVGNVCMKWLKTMNRNEHFGDWHLSWMLNNKNHQAHVHGCLTKSGSSACVCVAVSMNVFLASGEAASRALLQNTACHQWPLSVWECVLVCVFLGVFWCECELYPIAWITSNCFQFIRWLFGLCCAPLCCNLTCCALHVRSLSELTNPFNCQLNSVINLHGGSSVNLFYFNISMFSLHHRRTWDKKSLCLISTYISLKNDVAWQKMKLKLVPPSQNWWMMTRLWFSLDLVWSDRENRKCIPICNMGKLNDWCLFSLQGDTFFPLT